MTTYKAYSSAPVARIRRRSDMAAELCQTDDPKALIPGNLDSVHNTAWSLRVYGDVLHDAGAGLQRIDTAEGWSGEALSPGGSLSTTNGVT